MDLKRILHIREMSRNYRYGFFLRMRQEEERRMKEERKEAKKKEKELRRNEREEKRRKKRLMKVEEMMKKQEEEEEAKLARKIALEERKLLIAQRKLESIRLLDELFERIKVRLLSMASLCLLEFSLPVLSYVGGDKTLD